MNTEPTTTSPTVSELERDVEARSAVFKKELGLFDLVLTQVVFVVGTFWVGWAARLGSQQSAFWILAIITFYVPLAVAVIYLNRLMPYEGGLYQWSKLAFNDFVAFMVGWNLWVFAITILAGTGLVVTTNLSYAVGPPAAWIRDSRTMIMLISFVLVTAMVVAATRGLALGKWVHNVGGVVHMITFAVLILLPLFAISRALGGPYEPFTVQLPTFSEYNVNVGSKLALGALTGFEYIAIAAGETRSPAKNIARSVVISAPIIALMFILGTSSVVAFIPRDHIDVIGPIPQVLSIGFGSLGWVGAIGSIAILGIAVRTIALMSLYFVGNTRLPMVAGWDRLLPAWFSRLHAKYKTPINSILFVGIVTLVIGAVSLSGVHAHEAFQLIDNAGGVFYALTYLVLFAIPLFGMKALGVKAPWWLKIACASGFIVTLIYIRYSIVPITNVEDLRSFGLKIIVTVVIANVVGVALYVIRTRK
ncbi:MAG TPA: APC family permease [Pyrinomonadaceae bacterium]|nr:APC family permease [Pyrinomonadaceae bacterium]